MVKQSLIVFLSLLIGMGSAVPDDSTLLNHATFLMTHNSATGEDNGRLSPDVDNQSTSLVNQLICGARAFDYRPYLKSNGDVIAAHGIAKINVLMRDSVQSIINWLATQQQSSNSDELVIMYISHGDADNHDVPSSQVYDAAAAVLNERGVPGMIRNCNVLNGLTVGEAKQRSALSGGGSLLAVFGCVHENYDPSIECYQGGQDCTRGDSGPFQDFDAYMESRSRFPSASHVGNGRLWTVQAHWQYDFWGLFVSPSIISDETDSDLNNRVATKINNGEYNFLNFVQVDNVCNNGPTLKTAIDNFMLPKRLSNCLSSNDMLRPGDYIESSNGLYRAKYENDGRLCVYNVGSTTAEWCSSTIAPSADGGPGVVKMQSDGNLVMYTPTNSEYWSSKSAGHNGAHLTLQNDRNLVVTNSGGSVVWACSNNSGNSCSIVSSTADPSNDTCHLASQRSTPTPAPPPQCLRFSRCTSGPCCNFCMGFFCV